MVSTTFYPQQPLHFSAKKASAKQLASTPKRTELNWQAFQRLVKGAVRTTMDSDPEYLTIYKKGKKVIAVTRQTQPSPKPSNDYGVPIQRGLLVWTKGRSYLFGQEPGKHYKGEPIKPTATSYASCPMLAQEATSMVREIEKLYSQGAPHIVTVELREDHGLDPFNTY